MIVQELALTTSLWPPRVAEAGLFADSSTVPFFDCDDLLVSVPVIDSLSCGSINVKADLLGSIIAPFWLLRAKIKLDSRRHFLITELSSADLLPPQANLIPVDLEILVNEHVKFLLNTERIDISRCRLHLLKLLLLLLELPEPFVDLILFELELLGELESQLTRWHLAFIFLKLLI